MRFMSGNSGDALQARSERDRIGGSRESFDELALRINEHDERQHVRVLQFVRVFQHRVLGFVGIRCERDEMRLQQRRDIRTRNDALHESATLTSQLTSHLDEHVLLFALGARDGVVVARLPRERSTVVEVRVRSSFGHV